MISGANICARIIAMMPGQESVTLGSRLTGETGYTSVTYANTRRTPAKMDIVAMAGGNLRENWIVFELYKTTEATAAKVGDKITDADSVVWRIKKLEIRMQKTVYWCLCIQELA